MKHSSTACNDFSVRSGEHSLAILNRIAAGLLILLAHGAFLIPSADAANVLWSSSAGSAWLTGGNWTGGAVPTAADVAQFGVNPTSGSTGVGINFNSATNAGPQTNGNRIEDAGAVEITSVRCCTDHRQ